MHSNPYYSPNPRKVPTFTKSTNRKYFGGGSNTSDDDMKKSSILFHSVLMDESSRLLGSSSPQNNRQKQNQLNVIREIPIIKKKDEKVMYSSMIVSKKDAYKIESGLASGDKIKELNDFADELKRKLTPFLQQHTKIEKLKEDVVKKYLQPVTTKKEIQPINPFNKIKKEAAHVDYSKDFTDFNKFAGIYQPTSNKITVAPKQQFSAESSVISPLSSVPSSVSSANEYLLKKYSTQSNELNGYLRSPPSNAEAISISNHPYISASQIFVSPSSNTKQLTNTHQSPKVSNNKGMNQGALYPTQSEIGSSANYSNKNGVSDNYGYKSPSYSLYSTSSSQYNNTYASKIIQKKPLKKDDFQIGRKLGTGMFGEVFLVRHKELNFVCAMKILKKKVVKQQKVEQQLQRQIKIQFYLQHQNVINLYGFFYDTQNVFLLQQLCMDGHLFSMLKEKHKFQNVEAADIIRQICIGLDYVHRQKIIHRDIKPENIIMHQGIAKICDFGWAVYRGDGLRGTFCGTPLYTPPELLRGELYDDKFDIWAIGILAYELIVGRFPFKIFCEDDLNRILTDQITFPFSVEVTPDAKDFILSIIRKDPRDRIEIDSILFHPFLRKNIKPVLQIQFKM